MADSPQLYRLTTIDALLESVMSQMNRIFGFENAFLYVRRHFFQDGGGEIAGAVQMPADYYLGIGAYGEAADRVRNYLMERHETEFPILRKLKTSLAGYFPYWMRTRSRLAYSAPGFPISIILIPSACWKFICVR